MFRLRTALVALVILVSLSLLALQMWPLPAPTPLTQGNGDPKRGAYLARLSGCVTCHTRAGGEPLSGGDALNSRFGSFYAPNITSDPNVGIGSWTFQQFARAVRQGVSPEGEAYYPAFPYEFYASLTDRDLADLWAAIQDTPPSDSLSKSHEVPFPVNLRSGIKLWRTFFEKPSAYVPDPNKSASWNRGRYLVWGPAHCAACHVPRNMAGGLPKDEKLGGDPAMLDGQSSPPITPQALASRGYDKDTLVQALRSGVAPDGDVFGGSMSEVIQGSTRYLLNQHLEDMATYLLDLE